MGCRGRGLRSVLLRVVAVADDAGQHRAVVDVRRSLPGRGAWIHADPGCLELAEKRRSFPRALRTGPLDTSQVRAYVEDTSSTHVVSPGSGSGLEADGPPMSTQR